MTENQILCCSIRQTREGIRLASRKDFPSEIANEMEIFWSYSQQNSVGPDVRFVRKGALNRAKVKVDRE